MTKDKYFDTTKKVLSQEMTMCNMETLVSRFLEIITNVNVFFLKRSNVKVKRSSTNTKILSQAIFMWNTKALALTIQILLTGSKYSKHRPDYKVKVTRSKMLVPTERFWY